MFGRHRLHFASVGLGHQRKRCRFVSLIHSHHCSKRELPHALPSFNSRASHYSYHCCCKELSHTLLHLTLLLFPHLSSHPYHCYKESYRTLCYLSTHSLLFIVPTPRRGKQEVHWPCLQEFGDQDHPDELGYPHSRTSFVRRRKKKRRKAERQRYDWEREDKQKSRKKGKQGYVMMQRDNGIRRKKWRGVGVLPRQIGRVWGVFVCGS